MQMMMQWLFALICLVAGLTAAENGQAGWLRYSPLGTGQQSFAVTVPGTVVVLSSNTTSPVYTAGQELQNGIRGMLARKITVSYDNTVLKQLIGTPNGPETNTTTAIVIGTVGQLRKAAEIVGIGSIGLLENVEIAEDGFVLSTNGPSVHYILGQNERGALYGAFEYLSRIARHNSPQVEAVSNPHQVIRWVNQWDNLDGSIERGYGGPSISFANGTIRGDLGRAAEYARLLASIGVNGLIVNNVNANPNLLSSQNIEGLGRLADAYRPYGVQLGISLNFSSPLNYGVGSYDPFDKDVIAFWTNKTNELYRRIPDMAGYLVKANSEGQPGPLTYNRTLADGANMFGRAVKPHGGIVMFRAFVYNHLADWTNLKNDRAKAAVEFFQDLDGKFDDNIVVQIKYGPIDFQVREPASPLFAHLPNTAAAIELQVTQEYLGQQCHLVYLAPLWKEILDFDLRIDNKTSLVSDVVAGRRTSTPSRKLGGSAAVVNVGTDANWLGSHLAMSNLYAYGRLAWDPRAGSEEILLDWVKLTFGHDRAVADTILDLSMESWPAYENYTGNLGIQTLTDILHTHFGPGPESQDNNGWGQWTRADHDSIGMDRTVATGTGYAAQYPPQVGGMYESIATTPDNLLLWFHHVPYTHRLKSGKTVIQHFYDAHYDGAAAAQTFPARWRALKGRIDDERYEHMLSRLDFQAGHSIVWRDSIANFYRNLSGVPDEAGRVGSHPWRVEAEAMTLHDYRPFAVSPFHAASGRLAVVAAANATATTPESVAVARLDHIPDGTYDVAINYYDVLGGRAEYRLWLGAGVVGVWRGDAEDRLGHEPTRNLDGHSAIRVRFRDVTIKRGDNLRIVARADGIEPAPLDYVAILPAGVVD